MKQVAVTLALAFVACNHNDRHDSVLTLNPTNFAGKWVASRSVTGSTCVGNTVSTGLDGGFLQIEQIGETLTLMNLDACGDFVFGGTGQATANVATFNSDWTSIINPACTVTEHYAETVTLSGATLSGEMRYTIMDSAGCNTTSTPCENSGTLTATWCAPGECLSYPPSCQ